MDQHFEATMQHRHVMMSSFSRYRVIVTWFGEPQAENEQSLQEARGDVSCVGVGLVYQHDDTYRVVGKQQQ